MDGPTKMASYKSNGMFPKMSTRHKHDSTLCWRGANVKVAANHGDADARRTREPGCQCINCGNLHIFIPKVHDTTAVLDADGEDDESNDDDFEDLYGEDNGEDDTNDDNLAGGVVQDTETEKIMEFVFG